MVQVSAQWARRVRLLSTLFLWAGTLLVLVPLAWAAYSGFGVAGRQASALAEWETVSSPSTATSTDARLTLTVPRLGLRRFVPEGATEEHLRQFGMGRITWSAVPDQAGVVAIAGHRTTYGAPFLFLHRLQAGDILHLDYRGRRYTYSVVQQVVVRPDQVDIFDTFTTEQGIALVACTPIYSAAYRLVVFGRLLDVRAAGPVP